MNKKIKKLLILAITVCILFTSVLLPYEKTKAVSLEVGLIVLGVAFIGSACFACDYLSNPDKYSDLTESMKDFKNSTVENQKKLYEIEKANFEMVMQKAVDSNVGTCLIGSNGMSYSAKQLQSQEYPEFDTWKGYKEKQSEKPSGGLWDKFKLGAELAELICAIWPDGNGSGGSTDSGEEQLYYTGDDGYMDEDGNFTIRFKCRNVHYVDAGDTYTQRSDNSIVAYDNYSLTASGKFPTTNYRLWGVASGSTKNYFNEYDENGKCSVLFRTYSQVGITYYSGSGSYKSFLTYPGIADIYTFEHRTYNSSTGEYESGNSKYMYMSFQLLDGEHCVYLYDYLSTNIPVFDSFAHGQAYYSTGSLEGLINGAPESGPTPTDSPAPDGYIGPVRQYTNYFRNTFSPSMMANHVNYNIVNNWDGDTTTFNINNYTVEESDDNDVTATPTPDSKKPTFTPIPPNTDGGDTTNNYDINITNNLLIEQTNIIQNISNTVNNIYNFFQIDVDVIVEDLTPDTDSKFMPLYDMITDVNKLIPQDEFEVIEGQADPIISTLYPKITIKVPVILDDFLSFSDKKIMEEDGSKVIILCDFYDFRIYFARFRKFLQIVIYIGMFFYLMKEFSVIWSIQ